MLDVTQAMACIHCGVCVSACLSMEVDPEFIGPAALAKAYRFVGDPRDGEAGGAPARPRRGPARDLRLHPLLRLRRGLPEGRGARWTRSCACAAARRTTRDQGREQRLRPREGVRRPDREVRHAARGAAAAAVVRRRVAREGPADAVRREAADARAADRPSAGSSRQGLARQGALHPKLPDQKQVRRIFHEIESHDERIELNLYIVGEMGRGGRWGRAEVKLAYWPGCVSRGLHSGAARLRGEGRAAARSRAGGARPRELLRRRRDRRAQPGAGGRAQRAHVRHGPAGAGRGRDDEHLLHLPGRAVRVPGAAGRRAPTTAPR